MGTGIPAMFKSLNVFIEEMAMVYNTEKKMVKLLDTHRVLRGRR